MNLKFSDFDDNGASWPHDLANKKNLGSWEEQYFAFQSQAAAQMGAKITLKPHLVSKFFDQLAFDSAVIDKVKKLLGPDIYIWSSAIFAKAPGDGKIVSYHQDNPYWQLTTDNVITAWIAITDSEQISGCLELVPGSFKHGLINDLDVADARASYLSGVKTTEAEDMLSYKHDVDDFIQKNPPLPVELKAGQFSLHHVNTVHGSGVNKADRHRIGFAVRYISADTKHSKEGSDSATLVCGTSNPYFASEPRPSGDFTEEAITAHRHAMESAGAFGNKKY